MYVNLNEMVPDISMPENELPYRIRWQLYNLRCNLLDYMSRDLSQVKSYAITPKMYQYKVLPYTYLCRRSLTLASYTSDPIYCPTDALKYAIARLINFGEVYNVDRDYMRREFNFRGEAFSIKDPTKILALQRWGVEQ